MVLEEGRPVAEGAPAHIFQDEFLCLRAGLRQPALFDIAKRLRRRFGLDPNGDLPASASQLAEWLAAALAVPQGAPQ